MTEYTESGIFIERDHLKAIHKMYDKDSPDFSCLVTDYVKGLLCSEELFNLKAGTNWAIFSGDSDWLSELLQKHSIQEIFNRVLPFPRAGRNGCRPEIFLTAYADVVATSSQGEVVWIKGTEEIAPEQIKKELNDIKSGRVVAFSLSFPTSAT